jgi:hypothetical protein
MFVVCNDAAACKPALFYLYQDRISDGRQHHQSYLLQERTPGHKASVVAECATFRWHQYYWYTWPKFLQVFCSDETHPIDPFSDFSGGAFLAPFLPIFRDTTIYHYGDVTFGTSTGKNL